MNILIIQILRLGDAVQMHPVTTGLKEKFPDASIYVLTSVIGKQIFERQNEVDKVFVLHKQELAGLAQHPTTDELLNAIDLIKSDLSPVLDKKWDWVINFSFSFSSALLAFIADGAYCSGFHATRDRQYISNEKWFAYAVSAFVSRRYSIFNWVDMNKKIVGLMERSSEKSTLMLEEKEIKEAEHRLGWKTGAGKPILGIHPGASGNHKTWPLENFIDLAKCLVDKHNYKILVFGDKNETELGKAIAENLSSDALDLTGRTTLSQLAYYISLCSVLICNDSGPMHIASSVGVPVIAFFFSTHFIETGPYGENHIVIHPQMPCFPCQGSASCATRECLKSIKPHTVKRIILNHYTLCNHNEQFNIDPEDGLISIHISGFDPWNNLDWKPVGSPDMQFDDVLRLVFKITWICCLVSEDKIKIDEYIKSGLNKFSTHLDHRKMTHCFDLFTNDLANLQTAFNQGSKLCFEIQSLLVENNIDTSRIQHTGGELQKKEDEIVCLGDKQWLLPFVEYYRLSLENLMEKNMYKLSIKTATIYKEMVMITDILEKVSGRLSCLLKELKADKAPQEKIQQK